MGVVGDGGGTILNNLSVSSSKMEEMTLQRQTKQSRGCYDIYIYITVAELA